MNLEKLRKMLADFHMHTTDKPYDSAETAYEFVDKYGSELLAVVEAVISYHPYRPPTRVELALEALDKKLGAS